MKERPILFSGEMVKAILDGKKTQTRRIVKFPKHVTETPGAICEDGGGNWVAWTPGNQAGLAEFTKKAYPNGEGFPCKYGKAGDRLWVRETFCDNGGGEIEYKATSYSHAESWSPATYMPRRVSRLTLEIVSVRVERLWEITDTGALAEGVDRTNTSIPNYARERFKKLWESINWKRAPWSSNPWVWVIEFKRTRTESEKPK